MAHLLRVVGVWLALACVLALPKAHAYGVVTGTSSSTPTAVTPYVGTSYGGPKCLAVAFQATSFGAFSSWSIGPAGGSGAGFFQNAAGSSSSYPNAAGQFAVRSRTGAGVGTDSGTGCSGVSWTQYEVQHCGGLSMTTNGTVNTCSGPYNHCPSGSAVAYGATCTCAAGFKPGAGGTTCVADSCPSDGTAAGPFLSDTWQTATQTTSFCNAGCTVRGTASMGYSSAGPFTMSGPFRYDGTTCSDAGSSDTGAGSNDGTTGQDPPLACPRGKCPGTVNGTSVCVTCSVGSGAGPTTTTQNGAGSTTGTSSSSTSCAGNQCTTTTTTKDGAGATTGTTTTVTTIGSFCGSNPGHALCAGGNGGLGTAGSGGSGEGDESSFGGTCAAFTCGGDAIQCAIALEQHRKNCVLFTTETALSTLGTNSASGELVPEDHPRHAGNPSSVSLNFSTVIDQSDAIGAGCPSDVSVGMFGSIPFSQLCGSLQMLGTLLVGLSMFAAAFIVFRS